MSFLPYNPKVLLRLNASVPNPFVNLNKRIERYKNKPIDLAAQRRNRQIIKDWHYRRVLLLELKERRSLTMPLITKKRSRMVDRKIIMGDVKYREQDLHYKKKHLKNMKKGKNGAKSFIVIPYERSKNALDNFRIENNIQGSQKFVYFDPITI